MWPVLSRSDRLRPLPTYAEGRLSSEKTKAWRNLLLTGICVRDAGTRIAPNSRLLTELQWLPPYLASGIADANAKALNKFGFAAGAIGTEHARTSV